LPLMKEGSHWRLWIPSELAYGDRGAGNDIGPNQALVFEVELISVDKTAAKEEQPAQNPPAGEQKPDAEKPPAQ